MAATLKIFDPAMDAFLDWWKGLPLSAKSGRTSTEAHDAFMAGVMIERENCAFDAECHSGFWDPATIEAIAASLRARGDGEYGPDPVHLDRERYEQLLACEAALRGQEVPHVLD